MVSPPGWTEFVRVLVHQAELTIIGAGPQQTIIGQTNPYDYSQGSHRGIETSGYFGSTVQLNVLGIRFENMRFGITGGISVANLNVTDCSFSGNSSGVFAVGAHLLEVSDCSFDTPGAGGWGYFVYTNSGDIARVSRCVFTNVEYQPSGQEGIHFDSTTDVQVSDCDFFEGRFGITIPGLPGSSARITNCRFVGQRTNGIVFAGSNTVIDGCTLSQQAIGIHILLPNTDGTILNTNILDVTEAAIRVSDANSLNVSNCFLAHGPQYTVWEKFYCPKATSRSLPVLDLRNNNWGTTSADSIASWIHMCHYDAVFIPYIGQPVPTEPISFGSLKSQYR